ncbi:hypothetical protein AB9M92_21045 [Peribacillus frigoritolerans]
MKKGRVIALSTILACSIGLGTLSGRLEMSVWGNFLHKLKYFSISAL